MTIQKPKRLAPRQAQIAMLLAAGLSTREIAAELALQPGTVRATIATVYAKTGTRNRKQLYHWLEGRY